MRRPPRAICRAFGLNQYFKSRLYVCRAKRTSSTPNLVNNLHIGLNRLLGVTGEQNQIPLATASA